MLRTWKGFLLAALVGLAGPVTAQVDIEPYLKRDGFEAIKISPDGAHYAATVPMEDRTALVILRRSDKKVVARAVGVENSVVDDFWWANDQRVVIAMAERLGSEDQPYRTGELHGISIDGEQVKRLVGVAPFDGIGGTYGNSSDRVIARFIDPLPAEPRHVLIAVSDFSANPQTRVEKLDVYNGRRSPVAIAPVRRAWFVTDPSGEVRFAEGAGSDNFRKLYYRDNADADWRLVSNEAEKGFSESPLGFAADGITAYLQVEQAQGPDAVVAWNTRTGERREVLRDAVADPFAILYAKDGRSVAGVQYMDAGVRSRFVDDKADVAVTYRTLEKAFPGSAVSITSFTKDGRLALLQVWNDRMQGDFYLFDTQTRTASGVFAQRLWFNPERMAGSRGVTLKARDGMELRGYLTVPHGKEARSLPMVVMPHGGPYGIFDGWTFDDDAQLLAEAGYAVLRINFRGSGNYGRAYRAAGARQWGDRMQDDLTDATQWAIDQKIADPGRICIYGASYGGYAALMGVAKEPDLYRCAVGYVGVYDLEAMHRDNSRIARWARNWSNDWIGERDDLAPRSPTSLADRIKVPVLLAAGGKDERAPIAHSKKMERALRAAKVPVETVYFDTEGHGFYTKPHRHEFYTRLLDFLARHIGGMKAKPAEGGANAAR
ncbi:MAG TPA: prolyl oligopeptidase family serine peptidase [Lysobacter sp.]